jgi:toxin ParE1/3/4
VTKPVVLTDGALADIEEIGDYIKRDNPERAATFVVELRERCEAVGDNPTAARLRPKWGKGVRAVLHGDYVVAYRDEPDEVVILRVVHGARDIDRLLS